MWLSGFDEQRRPLTAPQIFQVCFWVGIPFLFISCFFSPPSFFLPFSFVPACFFLSFFWSPSLSRLLIPVFLFSAPCSLPCLWFIPVSHPAVSLPAARLAELAFLCSGSMSPAAGFRYCPFSVDLVLLRPAPPPLSTSIVVVFRVSSCFVLPVAVPPVLPARRLRFRL